MPLVIFFPPFPAISHDAILLHAREKFLDDTARFLKPVTSDPNGYFLFLNAWRGLAGRGSGVQSAMKHLGEIWQSLSPEERAPWLDLNLEIKDKRDRLVRVYGKQYALSERKKPHRKANASRGTMEEMPPPAEAAYSAPNTPAASSLSSGPQTPLNYGPPMLGVASGSGACVPYGGVPYAPYVPDPSFLVPDYGLAAPPAPFPTFIGGQLHTGVQYAPTFDNAPSVPAEHGAWGREAPMRMGMGYPTPAANAQWGQPAIVQPQEGPSQAFEGAWPSDEAGLPIDDALFAPAPLGYDGFFPQAMAPGAPPMDAQGFVDEAPLAAQPSYPYPPMVAPSHERAEDEQVVERSFDDIYAQWCTSEPFY